MEHRKAYGTPVFGAVGESFPVVSTTAGQVVGENKGGIAVFRGIPYGDSCDRKRRFLPPEPVSCWDGVRDCTRNGAISIQAGESIVASKNFAYYFGGGHPESFGAENETQSENCLFLNVLTPKLTGKRPVMVYIHGGGFATNSGTVALGADRLCREEDVVVVSMNHRLHFWGYLYLAEYGEKYQASGNVGQLDLILALTWVRDNIAAFGGDPGNVTLWGESGGGGKINHLLHMPLARGLFHKAIVTSGSMPVGRLTKESAAQNTEIFLSRLGIGRSNVELLETLPASALMAAAKAQGDMFGGSLSGGEKTVDYMSFAPVADGVYLPEGMETGYEIDSCCEDIPMIIGSSEDEMACFMAERSFDIRKDNFREKLLERGPGFGLPVTQENVDAFISVYESCNLKGDGADHIYLKMISQGSTLGNGAFYQAMARAKAGAAPVFLYLNRYDAPHNYLTNRRYAWHTFDTPLQMRLVPYPELEPISRAMTMMWAEFARSGNPSIPGYIWHPFTMYSKETMVFDNAIFLAPDPMKAERAAYEALFN